jgi:hypothetical protein
VARVLWPAPTHVRIGSKRGRGRGHTASYVIVPSAARPKLLIPSRPRKIAAGAMRNFKTAADSRDRMQAGALSLAARLGLHSLLPHRVIIDAHSEPALTSIDAHLSEVLERPLYVSLYIGPPRAVRKPVLQVLDPRGNTFAFAKLGIDAFTNDLVTAEARAVTELSTNTWNCLSVPTVLYAGVWRDHQLLVQSAVPRGPRANVADGLLSSAMSELASFPESTSAALARSSYWHRLTGRIGRLPESSIATVLARSQKTITETAGDTVLDFGASHGDWAPWNMTIVEDRVMVWDWEKFEHDVPVGFDAVHFDVQGAVVMGDATPFDAFRSALIHPSRQLSNACRSVAPELLIWLYAVDIATRYVLDGEEVAGRTKMSEIGSWLAPVLQIGAQHTTLALRR